MGKLILLVGVLVSILSPKIVLASCVVPARIPYELNSECNYPTPPANLDYYDTCYQQHMDRKYDYETRCFRYWDDKKAEEELKKIEEAIQQDEDQPQVVEKTIIKEVIAMPSPQVNHQLSPSPSSNEKGEVLSEKETVSSLDQQDGGPDIEANKATKQTIFQEITDVFGKLTSWIRGFFKNK